jgi:integrase
MAKLTVAAVQKFRATEVRREIADGAGLYLVIQPKPSGHKSWALRYRRPDGRPAKLTLGDVDLSEGKEPEGSPQIGAPLSLVAAHALAADQLRNRARGIDVAAQHVAEKRRQKVAAIKAAENSFPALARMFIDNHKVKKHGERPRRWRENAVLFGFDYPSDGGEPSIRKNSLAERWRNRELRSISGDELHDLVIECQQTGVPGRPPRHKGANDSRGRAMSAVLSKFFAWAKEQRHLGVNSALDLYRPEQAAARQRVLNARLDVRRADELRWFWAATGSTKISEPFGTLLKLLLLTGCRLNELAELRIGEVSDDQATLRIPGSRSKNHRPFEVYLPPQACKLLASVKRKDGPYVFSTTGKTPVSGWSKIKLRLDEAMLTLAREERGDDYEIAPWRIHDLRRTAATGMAGIGIAPHIVEACLNHISGAKASVAGVYNVEQYEPEKRAAWTRWAAHVEAVVTGKPATVISLPARA